MNHFFMHDMPWLENTCQTSRWGRHQLRKTPRRQSAKSSLCPLFFCIAALPPSPDLTDDTSCGIKLGGSEHDREGHHRWYHRWTQSQHVGSLKQQLWGKLFKDMQQPEVQMQPYIHWCWISGLHDGWCQQRSHTAYSSELNSLAYSETHSKTPKHHCSAAVEVKRAPGFPLASSQILADYKELMGIIVPSLISGIF